MQEKTKGLSDMQDNEEIQVEDFIPYKEYPVGGYFRIGKEVFKVVNDDTDMCYECDIERFDNCSKMPCGPLVRSDRQGVNFIVYDTEE